MPADPARVKALFQAAIDHSDPAARRAFLDRETAGDPAVRGRVDALLTAFDDATSVSSWEARGDNPSGAAADATDGRVRLFGDRPSPPADSGGPGAVLAGRYKMVERIGEGGMGSVWAARQSSPVKRTVAVKLIKAGMDSKAVLVRFEAERQALALMDHPHIAKVLDAGTTEQGRPFFVMELVKGIPVTDFCDHYRLDVPARLALLRQVCGAVQHAHQKGVIHRDLKPTNVLVESHDGTPVPKVIDFGLAKATAGGPLPDQTVFTGFGMVSGTPLYMAPEQALFNARDVDTRADVYALGAILYELLTGTTPIPREAYKEAAVEKLLRTLREVEPPAPSSRLGTAPPGVAAFRRSDPKRLGRLVRGDLDRVVMKALAKERHLRYESAAALADDLGRFLNHEPVAAVPPGTGYRLRKFARRNRGPVAAAVVVLLALVGGVVGTTLGLLEARRHEQLAVAAADAADAARRAEADQREAAVKKEAEANAVVEFFQKSVFVAARPKGREGGLGRDITLRAAIDAAAPAIRGKFDGQPLVEARLRQTLGRTYWHLDDHETAVAQFERARAVYAEHLGPDHPDTLTAMHNLALCYAAVGRLTDARVLDEQTLAARNRRLGPSHPHTLLSMYNLACLEALAAGRGQPAEAAAAADRAVDWLAKAVAAGFDDRAHIESDNDFDALRDRPDFRKLVASLPERAPPPRRAKVK